MIPALIVTFAALVAVLFALAVIEASLLHLRRSAVAEGVAVDDKRTVRLRALLDRLPQVMNAVLLAVLLTQVTATTVAGVAARHISDDIGVTVTTVVVTVVLFVYGEAIPKTIALRDPLRQARRLVGLTHALDVLLAPFVSGLLWFARLQSPTPSAGETADTVTERELRHIAGRAAARGQIERSDAELIERSFRLGDARARGIMVPLGAVVSVANDGLVREALNLALATGHRRLGVYEDSPNQLTGFVRLRDLAEAAASRPATSVSDLSRQGLRLPMDARVIDVLRTMQSTGQHFAVLADPRDRTVGIVTIEDIVAQLVGSISEPPPAHHGDRKGI